MLKIPRKLKWVVFLAFCSTCSIIFLVSFNVTSLKNGFPNYKGTKMKPRYSSIITIASSNIKSRFDSLETYSCNKKIYSHLSILWNNDYWQNVNITNIYLFKAYYDTRTQFAQKSYHYIRILASIPKKTDASSLFCHLWLDPSSNNIVVETEILEIWDQRWDANAKGETYRTFLISCPVPLSLSTKRTVISHVSITSKKCENPTNKLSVNSNEAVSKSFPKNKKFVICVKSLNYQKDISARLVEWIELNLILGADKIILYLFNVHKNISKVLAYYSELGLVELIPFSLPGDQPNEIQERASYLRKHIWQKRRNEIITYNDCLYKNIYESDFIIPLDIDEVIVPVSKTSWSEMLDEFLKIETNVLDHFASLSVRNGYFFHNLPHSQTVTSNPVTTSHPTAENIPLYHYILNHKIRSANFSEPSYSVKSFVLTAVSKTTFNHYAFHPIFMKTKIIKNIPLSIAQMNHYKEKCPREMYLKCKNIFLKYTTEDLVVMKYKDRLISRTAKVMRKLDLL